MERNRENNREKYIDVTDLHKLWFKTTGEPLGYATSLEVRVYNKVDGTMKIISLEPPDFLWGTHVAKIIEIK